MYQIGIIGSAVSKAGDSDWENAVLIGLELAKKKADVFSGATTGTPLAATLGAKQLGAHAVGISPAFDAYDHVNNYNLPIEHFDTMIYCGNGYLGRSLTLVYSCDGVVMIGGRMGTVEELSIAIHQKLPVAILDDGSGVTDEMMNVLEASTYDLSKVFFEKSPQLLIDRLYDIIDRTVLFQK